MSSGEETERGATREREKGLDGYGFLSPRNLCKALLWFF